MSGVHHNSVAVFVENFAPRCVGLNGVACGTFCKLSVLTAVNNLPVNKTCGEKHKESKRNYYADGNRRFGVFIF